MLVKVHFGFHYEENILPLLFFGSEHSVAKEVILQTLNISIESPCQHLMLENTLNDVFWCNSFYNEFIIKQITNNCPLVTNIDLDSMNLYYQRLEDRSLKNRFPRSLLSSENRFHPSILSLTTMLGFYYDELSDNFESAFNDNENLNLFFTNLIETKLISHNIHMEFYKHLIDIMKHLNKTENQMNHSMQESKRIAKRWENFFGQLLQIDLNLREFFHSLRNKQISEHFDYLFPNLTFCQYCPRKYWIGDGCQLMNRNHNMQVNIQIKMLIFIPDDSLNILQVDPFNIMRKENDNLNCFYKYVGNELFLHDQSSKCLADIYVKPTIPTAFIFTSKMDQNCIEIGDQLLLRSLDWKRMYCIKWNDVLPEQIIQVKSDYQYNYVYCFTLNLIIFSHTNQSETIECENLVYKIPYRHGFAIQNNSLKYRIESKRIYYDSNRIVDQKFFFSKKATENKLNQMQNKITNERKDQFYLFRKLLAEESNVNEQLIENKQQNIRINQLEILLYSSVLVLIILSFLIILVLITRKKR